MADQMMRLRRRWAGMAGLLALAGVAGLTATAGAIKPPANESTPVPTTARAGASAAAEEPDEGQADVGWKIVEAAFPKSGKRTGDRLVVTIGRGDLEVVADGRDIPGDVLQTRLTIWRCDCGKFVAIGSYVVTDYEANDVIDAVRKDGHVKVAGMSPVMVDDRPRIVSVNVHGEGKASELMKVLKEPFRWTGAARTATRPVEIE